MLIKKLNTEMSMGTGGMSTLAGVGLNELWARWAQTEHECFSQAELARAFFWRLKANGHIIVIITSYQEFPGRIENPYDDRHTTPQDRMIHEAVDGYVHCFRWGNAHLKKVHLL